jgi:diguanylate cyclase (GGDEF)-like protein
VVGDVLLCVVSGHFGVAAGGAGWVARVAGDEFAVVLPGARGAADVAGIARRARRALLPLPGDGGPAPRLSVGAVLARDGEAACDVLRRADEAMYAAKRRRP